MSVHICAEIGSSHCGSAVRARTLIQAAKQCGADSVKFQLFRGRSLYADPERQQRVGPYEVPLEWLGPLSIYTHELGLQFIVTPFAVDLVPPLAGLIDAVKISAYDLTFLDLVKAAAALQVPFILSTAMSIMEEVAKAACAVWDVWGLRVRHSLTVLHGVAQYPARLEDQNLNALRELQSWSEYFQTGVGLSDHTIGHEAAVIATALGATWIEKHFRLLDTPTESPDYLHSATPPEFKQMVEAVRRTERALGDGCKDGPLDCEKPLLFARRTNEKRLRG